MTQGDRRPGRFERGQRLSAAALNAVVESVLSLLDRRVGHGLRQPLNMLGVLQSDLYAAVDWKNDPSTAVVRIARKNTAGDYEITTQEETVVNRFENISLDAGTLIGIEWIDGEWQPYKADCIAGSDSVPGAGGSAGDSLLENQPPGGPSPP